jgi:hypothetical protein
VTSYSHLKVFGIFGNLIGKFLYENGWPTFIDTIFPSWPRMCGRDNQCISTHNICNMWWYCISSALVLVVVRILHNCIGTSTKTVNTRESRIMNMPKRTLLCCFILVGYRYCAVIQLKVKRRTAYCSGKEISAKYCNIKLINVYKRLLEIAVLLPTTTRITL